MRRGGACDEAELPAARRSAVLLARLDAYLWKYLGATAGGSDFPLSLVALAGWQ